MNGLDFDYYMIAFCLTDNYDEYVSEIQSVIDSFSYGVQGPLNPGPITSFLNESPNRSFKNYTQWIFWGRH